MYGKKKMMYGGKMARENKMGGGMSVNKEKRRRVLGRNVENSTRSRKFLSKMRNS